ncbi:hypothetical protein Pla52o_34070 [Novipirellula galeiformis]|uniref:Uncharacterized protein n=1 Tax=Novipirellula galeiformis TaxID=2528004 RepID=A0A5C6CGE3_9BACT|nr:hypothetical protein Pla52o_34070 [Novipirellula galeiformis]
MHRTTPLKCFAEYYFITRSGEYRKMDDRKMMMLHLGADHFSVSHLPVNSASLD